MMILTFPSGQRQPKRSCKLTIDCTHLQTPLDQHSHQPFARYYTSIFPGL